MKLMYFHLMPYMDLPEDFAEKHESVWVDVNSTLFDPRKAHHMYHEFISELEHADAVGFDAICVNEHHCNAYGMLPSPNLMASTLARSTTNAAICVMGNSLALYNPPTRVAEEFAMLDCLSGGRLIAGFPVGTPMDTCYAYGQNPSQLRQRYHEAHDLIMRCWTETEPFAFHGRFNQQRYVNPWPRPIQQPHPPVWIPGGGAVETWRWCADVDYVYAYLSYYGYLAGQATMQGFWQEMKNLGKEPNPFRAAFLQFVGVAETEQEALDLYREPAEYFYNRSLKVSPKYVAPPGYMTEATLRARAQSQVAKLAGQTSGADAAGAGAAKVEGGGGPPSFEEMVEKGFVVIGSPDQVAEKLTTAIKDLHFGNLMVLLQYGNMRRDLATYNTDMFAKYVRPQIENIFENEWEHHWWPEPMSAADRVGGNPHE